MKYRFPFRKLFENKYCTQNIALIKLNVYKFNSPLAHCTKDNGRSKLWLKS